MIALLIGLGGAAALWTVAAPDACQRESAYFCISVESASADGSERLLRMDTLRHAYVDLDDPTHLEFGYTRLLGDVADALVPAGEPIDALHIGGGGFTLPRYIAATRPGSANRVLELDPVVVEVAETELGLERTDDLSIAVGDARLALEGEPTAAYDLVIGDAFGGPAVPWHLTTREFVAEIARSLRPGGIYAANIIDYPPLALARAQLATFAEVFPYVGLIGPASRAQGTTGGNLILLASDQPLPAEGLVQANRARGGGDVVTHEPEAVARFIADSVTLRDDFAPTDQLLTR